MKEKTQKRKKMIKKKKEENGIVIIEIVEEAKHIDVIGIEKRISEQKNEYTSSVLSSNNKRQHRSPRSLLPFNRVSA